VQAMATECTKNNSASSRTLRAYLWLKLLQSSVSIR